jgi:nitroreductase
MNEILKAIRERRSIRKYKAEQIKDSELNAVLEAGTWAATGKGQQSPVMVVVQDAETIAYLSGMNAQIMGNPGADPFYGAPTVVLISSVVDEDPYGNVNYSNAASIAQNMALAACDLGVGACHIWGAVRTLNNCPDLLCRLPIPEGMKPVCSVALGHTDEVYTLREIPQRFETAYLK